METTPTTTDWASRIRPHLDSAAESIIAAGKELLAAKEALPHGQFGPLLNELDLPARTAQRFMAIARHPVLSDPTHVSHLPGAWGTLYELSRLPDEVVESALHSGDVSASMRREEAQALRTGGEYTDPRLAAITNAVAELDKALRVAEQPNALTPEVALQLFADISDLSTAATAMASRVVEEYAGRLRMVTSAEDAGRL